MIPPNWIDATELNSWANRRDAQARLPQLLRRLINATVQRLLRIGFPAGDSVQMGGWDGIVETSEGNAFVPAGYSVWELGVTRGVKGKADSDYQKRCTDSLGLIPAETTFVFVTLRRWGGKNDWIREKNSEGIWAEVRAYDADDLEQWLELAPAVHTWLARLIGKWSEDTQDLSSFWDEWTNSTSPSMTPELHLAGREQDVEKVKDWLNESPFKLSIQADSYEEAVAFFAAVIHEMPEDVQVQQLSRCILVNNESSWRYLVSTQDPLILIPAFNQLKFIPQGHHVLVPIGREISPSKEALQLPRLARASFRQALANMGFSEERAYALSRESKRNLLVLRRLLARDPEIHTPDWAKPENARSLISVLLAGAWNETKEADREAIAALARKPYEEVITDISRWLNTSDPPIDKTGDVWQLVSREVTWHFLSRFLVSDDLEALENVVNLVLGTFDPRYELPPDQRFAANVYGKELPHSGFLRQGLVETLAILSTRGLPSEIQDVTTAQNRVNFIVHKLLNTDSNWQQWASLSGLLSTLAEAAPEAFLEAVEQGLDGESPTLLGIFQESIWGDSPHTGLLWALETFAWEPIYLSRAALILAKLSRLDPGGKLLNRPFNSLCEIFLCWNPQTPATLQQRLRVIDTLLIREPVIAWKLLCNLLPEFRGGISHPIHQPRWRDWNSNYTPKVTVSEYWQSIKALVEHILSNAGTSSEKWCDVIKRIDSLPTSLLNLIIDALHKVNTTGMQPIELAKIWSSLREIIHKHREFPDAQWAMPQEVVDKLDLVYQKFAPQDLVHRYAWLFTFNPDFIISRHQDWKVNQDIVRKAQAETAREIYSLGGVAALVKIAEHAEQPRLLGSAIAKIEAIADSEAELLRATLGQETTALNDLAIGFVIGRMEIAGWNWVEETLQLSKTEQWSSQKVVNFFWGLPFEHRTWKLLDSFNEEFQKLYWQTTTGHWIHQNDCEIAIRKLLEVNRPYAALELANSCLRDTNEAVLVTPALLIEILEKAASGDPYKETPLPLTSMINYYIECVFHTLEKSDVVEKHDIAKLEWMYLPVLTHSTRQPKVLHQELSKDPLFFVEILKFIYKSENDQDEAVEPDAMQQATRFKLGYELLNSWHQIPGLISEQIDASLFLKSMIHSQIGRGLYVCYLIQLIGNYIQLRDWVLKARVACQENGRRKIGDKKIGTVLAYSPKALDGIWPDVAVREIIEEVSSRDLELGIEIGVYNKRGVWSKSLGEGGIQERQLSETYRNYAAVIVDIHPRTASMLRRIANSYESDAHGEDVRSELEYW